MEITALETEKEETMKPITKYSYRVEIAILSFLFIMEEVSLFAAAAIVYLQRFSANEIGWALLVVCILALLGFANLFAFSATYFYLRKLIKQEQHSTLLWALSAAVLVPLMVLFGSHAMEYAIHYFFGIYAVAVGFPTLMKVCDDKRQ